MYIAEEELHQIETLNNGLVLSVPHLQLIHNISRDFHDKIIKCEVHNAVGKSEESKTLDISCKYK